MSESENCVEQREEAAEVEEAVGAEVTRFKLFSSLNRCHRNTPQLLEKPTLIYLELVIRLSVHRSLC